MYALPEQTLGEAIDDIKTACALAPAHISYYQLTLEPGTQFHARPPSLPDEDAAWAIQSECQQILAAHHYQQYEVSAYAKPGAHCRHNLNYWLFGDYVGVGAGAHGKLSLSVPDGILRTAKPKQPRTYQEQLREQPRRAEAAGALDDERAIGERKLVAARDLPFEFMLNALRLNDGFAIHDFEDRTGLAFDAIEAQVHRVRDRGLIESTARGWRPTALGARFLNDLQAAFLA
jgi:oxygen-independent coproporphyrinogen-3 oxidase